MVDLLPLTTFLNQPDIIGSWCDGSSDWSLLVDPLSYYSFEPVHHDWSNKGCGIRYPVDGMVHIKDLLLLIKKVAYVVVAVGFLSCYPNGPLPYNHK